MEWWKKKKLLFFVKHSKYGVELCFKPYWVTPFSRVSQLLTTHTVRIHRISARIYSIGRIAQPPLPLRPSTFDAIQYQFNLSYGSPTVDCKCRALCYTSQICPQGVCSGGEGLRLLKSARSRHRRWKCIFLSLPRKNPLRVQWGENNWCN